MASFVVVVHVSDDVVVTATVAEVVALHDTALAPFADVDVATHVAKILFASRTLDKSDVVRAPGL